MMWTSFISATSLIAFASANNASYASNVFSDDRVDLGSHRSLRRAARRSTSPPPPREYPSGYKVLDQPRDNKRLLVPPNLPDSCFKTDWPDWVTAFWKPDSRTGCSTCPAVDSAQWATKVSVTDAPVVKDAERSTPWPSSSHCISSEYVPSKFESYWTQNIKNLADIGGGGTRATGWACGCSHLKAAMPYLEHWMSVWDTKDSDPRSTELGWSPHVFSHHRIVDTCAPHGGRRILAFVPIEPLVGILRHPFYHCFPEKVPFLLYSPLLTALRLINFVFACVLTGLREKSIHRQ